MCTSQPAVAWAQLAEVRSASYFYQAGGFHGPEATAELGEEGAQMNVHRGPPGRRNVHGARRARRARVALPDHGAPRAGAQAVLVLERMPMRQGPLGTQGCTTTTTTPYRRLGHRPFVGVRY